MNPFEFGAADNEENDERKHHAGTRVIASLFVAFFAYLGLALGGGINLAARADAEAFSSGRDSQPLYIAQRDPLRGIVVSDRTALPKATWHDIGPVTLAAIPSFGLLVSTWQPRDRGDVTRPEIFTFRAYLARAPPASFV
ncbi:hypothetical protein HB780_28850 [Rhizobium lusitanum]|uniref:hypothetical protein n=1 Tax=Rhizobium lusitanum TaxID=293958 RepID=UPI0016201D91|nr:hypothetical protein [Rhizobium lusitanum]QND49506.1 hypothetical protein HB780_28850 [Rhizobium lusitanum]